MGVQRIALTRGIIEVNLMHALLKERGLHPSPQATGIDVISYGGETSHYIEVPDAEVAAAIELLQEHGFSKSLITE
jgi:hypothetical protein